MNKTTSSALLSVFILTLGLPVAVNGAQSDVIQLTRPEDIQHASTMDQAIVTLSNRVMECVQKKLAPANECYCLYPQELDYFRKTYEGTIKQHPDWTNKIVSYTREGKSYAVSFEGISRQLERKCSQSK